MTDTLTELASVMEGEIRVGEELFENLGAQKKAILSWDSSALLDRVEEKEALVRRLRSMEKKRQEIVTSQLRTHIGENPSLKELLRQVPPGPGTARLGTLQIKARDLYSRLRLEDKRLVNLMEFVLAHIREALGPLSRSPLNVYGKTGVLAQPPKPGLVRGKV